MKDTGKSILTAIAIGVAVLILFIALFVGFGHSDTGVCTRSFILNVYSTTQASQLVSSTQSKNLCPGDLFEVRNGENNSEVSVTAIESMLGVLQPVFHFGTYKYAAGTAGIGNVEDIMNDSKITTKVNYVSDDYEPNFEPEFSFTWSVTLRNAQNFANAVYPTLHPLFYPTGRAMCPAGDQCSAGWNEGQLGSVMNADGGFVSWQTQGFAGDLTGKWIPVLKTLLSSHNASKVPLSTVSVQVSILCSTPSTCTGNQVTPAEAEEVYDSLYTMNPPEVYFYAWWGDPTLLDTFLTDTGRA